MTPSLRTQALAKVENYTPHDAAEDALREYLFEKFGTPRGSWSLIGAVWTDTALFGKQPRHIVTDGEINFSIARGTTLVPSHPRWCGTWLAIYEEPEVKPGPNDPSGWREVGPLISDLITLGWAIQAYEAGEFA